MAQPPDPIRIRMYDRDGRCPEAEREFAALDMLAMTAIEAALDEGRRVEIEKVERSYVSTKIQS